MILEYPAFDPNLHVYIVATSGGDGWAVVGRGLLDAIRADIAANEAEVSSIEDWIDSLAVWTRDETQEVARWHRRDGWSVMTP
jgi:hypothetical protein